MKIAEADKPYERELISNPYNVRGWQRYLYRKEMQSASFESRALLHQRALQWLPGSYQLWKSYLLLLQEQCMIMKKQVREGLIKRSSLEK